MMIMVKVLMMKKMSIERERVKFSVFGFFNLNSYEIDEVVGELRGWVLWLKIFLPEIYH